MKLVDLVGAMPGTNIGKRVKGRKTLYRSTEFPELLLREVASFESALRLGGVLLDFGAGQGMTALMCQDARALANFDLTKTRAGTLVATPGERIGWDTGTDYVAVNVSYRDEYTGTDVTSTSPPPLQRWCAIVTPCNGIGGFGPMHIESSYGVQSPPDWQLVGDGYGANAVNRGSRFGGSFLSVWRHVPLASQLSALTSDSFIDRLADQYSTPIRSQMRDAIARELAAVGDVQVGIDVSYARYDADSLTTNREFGIGVQNRGFIRSATGTVRDKTTGWRFLRAAVNEDTSNPAAMTDLSKTAVDMGFYVRMKDGARVNACRGRVGPTLGYMISANQPLPETIVLGTVGLDCRGFLKDMLCGDEPAWLPQFEGVVYASDLVSADVYTRTTDASGSGQRIGTIKTYESIAWPEFLTEVGNCCARAEAGVTNSRVLHVDGGRLFDVGASKTGGTQYKLVLPGTRWNGASMKGAAVDFSSSSGPVVTRTRTSYMGRQYEVWNVRSSSGTAAYATVLDGSKTFDGTEMIRADFTVGTQKYGTEATSTSPPGPGVLLRMTPSSDKWTVVETYDPA